MRIFEKRTYSVMTGHMPEVTRLYQQYGWPAINEEGFGKHILGYFISDTGPLHQLIHILDFESDDQRREFWKNLYASERFMSFAKEVRPHIKEQNVQLLTAAPWGPEI